MILVEDLIRLLQQQPPYYGLEFEMEVCGAGDESYRGRRRELPQVRYAQGNVILILEESRSGRTASPAKRHSAGCEGAGDELAGADPGLRVGAVIRAQLASQPGSIFFLGDVPDDEAEIGGLPMLGSGGHTLSRALRACGLVNADPLPRSFMASHTREVARLCWERRAFSVSTVFDFALGRDGIGRFCADARGRDACLKDGTLPTELAGLPGLPRTGYPTDPVWVMQLGRLRRELVSARPNIVVSLGDLALWTLTGQSSTDEWRGAPRLCAPDAPIMRGATDDELSFLRSLKVFPTFPPSRIHAQYKLLQALLADLGKVRYEAGFPEIRPLEIAVWLEPSLVDLQTFFDQHIRTSELLTLDIETAVGQITSVQVGTSPTTALVLPFVDYRRPSRSYWATEADELAAWDWLERVLDTPQPKLGQNFSAYDAYWLLDKAGLTVRNYRHDLRLAHHIYQPELPKDLAFMGATYTNLPAWKAAENKGHGHMRADEKRDE